MSIETNCKQGSGNKYKDVSDALYNIEAIVQQGEGFIYQCMNFLHHGDNADFFLGLRSDDQKIIMDNTLPMCLTIIALEELKRLLTPIERLPLRLGGESGSEYINRLLHAHPDLCKEQLRLDRNIFVDVVTCMKNKNLLSDGRYISVAEQLGIFLYIMAKGSSYRDAVGRFPHSIATIGLYFKQVLEEMVHLSTEIIRPYQSLTVVPKKIGDSTKYWPYFKDCVGALDETHINAVLSDDDGVAHRGRKGKKTWNVLAAFSFDRLFTFINVGFEGSAHDINVWNHCLTVPEFRFPHPPPEKYYLVDSGYPNTVGYLSPIKEKDIRTHLPEFRNGPPPQGMLELFNYLHSSLRTTIERCFGQLKGRWKILTMMPQMDTKHQLAIMVATFTLHNFIRLHELDIPIDSGIEIEPRADYDLFNENRKAVMKEVQLNIAKEIWNFL
uniref:DDE Tnp4 domain-containing protein n=1 Tax=Chenopodium quinoa TaxID=63459 RepID=A0A803MTN3_CHEQI